MISRRSLAFAIAWALVAASCNQNSDYLAVAGGGFMFNYRIAEASYGIALKPMRELPADGVIEASFENPAGGAPITMSKAGPFNPTRIAFDTPPVTGVVKKHPYKVTVVLKDGAGQTLQTLEKTFSSDLDQSVLPDKPLVIGPGYDKNVDGSVTAYPPSIGSNPPELP
jgi:hypothetical protein